VPKTLLLEDIVTELEPSLDVMEAALTDLEIQMGITKTCLCTVKCEGIGGKVLS